jgi:hypothetical protein
MGYSTLSDFLDGETLRPMVVEGPPLMLHFLVSTLSAITMLMLACTLRVQNVRRLRPRLPVAEAIPVLQVYGMVPRRDDEATTAEEEDSSHEMQALAPSDVHGTNDSAMAIGLELAAPSRTWRSACVTAQPIASVPVALGERIDGNHRDADGNFAADDAYASRECSPLGSESVGSSATGSGVVGGAAAAETGNDLAAAAAMWRRAARTVSGRDADGDDADGHDDGCSSSSCPGGDHEACCSHAQRAHTTRGV